MPDTRDPRFYRQMAEKSRTKADAAEDPMLRQSYLDLAASYVSLAETLERIARNQRPTGSTD